MRWPRLSLAAKYRFLFGLAVLLIIAAALSVPWARMNVLVLQQPYREAQRIADDYFRRVLPSRRETPAPGVHGELRPMTPVSDAPAPLYIRHDSIDEKLITKSPYNELGPFIRRAIDDFERHRTHDEYWRVGQSGGERRFWYANAIRVTRGCLECHSEGRREVVFHENQLAGVIVVDLPDKHSALGMLQNEVFTISAGVIAGILAILVFYVITKRFILSPIDELVGVAIRVGEGDLGVRSALRTGDEFERLSENLNTMLERLRDSQEELKRANLLLDQKLGEMAETNVALYESNRVKSEFLANVSHELRTPLTSIIGFAELLRETPPQAADRDVKFARYAENILISGRILLEIINDLLDLAKIEAGKVELRLEPVDVRELCATLVDFMRPGADKKRQTLELRSEDGLPPLMSDRGRLRQILFNLLSNAVKFTPDEGRVVLTAERAGDDILLSVEDSGPGVNPEHQKLIFEKFRQVDQSATREYTGTGLGLAIAKELTFLLNGEIGVESEPGQGARFWVRLPTHAPAPRDRPLVTLT